MNINRSILFFVVIFSLILSGCDVNNNSDSKSKGRFIVLERFNTFDGSYYEDKGKMIQDKVTGRCYLYLWGGAGNGGPAITETDCPGDQD